MQITKQVSGQNLRAARSLGKITYIGMPCGNDPEHGCVRYTRSSNCVACDKAKSRRKYDIIMAARGSTRRKVVIRPPYTKAQLDRLHEGRAEKYFGRPCKNGHDGLRYAKGSVCVACAQANNPPRGLTRAERATWKQDRRREKRAAEKALMERLVAQAKAARAREAEAKKFDYEDLW